MGSAFLGAGAGAGAGGLASAGFGAAGAGAGAGAGGLGAAGAGAGASFANAGDANAMVEKMAPAEFKKSRRAEEWLITDGRSSESDLSDQFCDVCCRDCREGEATFVDVSSVGRLDLFWATG